MTPAATLSVCSLTAGPGPRLATILEELRAVADEIIVAVDSRVDPSRLGHHARVADRIVRFEFAPPIERARPWLFGLCSGEWILEIDDDEVLSRSFLARLPDLLLDRTYRQHFLPCHWLFPDATHWLDEPPWSYEGARMFRNDPATMWIPGISHTRVEPAFPSTHSERGFYHLVSLLADESTRREKARYYRGIDDRHRIASTDRDMAAFYLPELVAGVRPVPVPQDDHDAIAAVLTAAGEELPTPEGLVIPLATRAEIDAHWPERELAETAYEAELTILDRTIQLAAGEHRPVHVRVSNRGSETWPWTPRTDGWPYPFEHRPVIRLSYRWYRSDGSLNVSEGYRTGLPANLHPDDTTVVPMIVAAPDEPGDYLLEADLVHEHVRWFDRPTRALVTVHGTGA
jgi:hypothetical protein